MIIKASARANGGELARHLMNMQDNEHVELVSLRGFISDNLYGAFEEAEALCAATRRASKYLFSLSLNPPSEADISIADFERAADLIEEQFGLSEQPRAFVLHEKKGRLHAHLVYSRIDAATLTAKPLPFFKRGLMGIAHELYLEHGWEMPNGLKHYGEAKVTNYELPEAQQAKRIDRDPEELKRIFVKSWQGSDGLNSFNAALQEQGFALARGDRRGFAVVDADGTVFSLSRWMKVKTKELKLKLGNPNDLPDIETAQKALLTKARELNFEKAQREKDDLVAHIKPMLKARRQLIAEHQEQRRALKLMQDQRSMQEAVARSSRFARGLRAVWEWVTGKRNKVRDENQRDFESCRLRDLQERDDLGAKQRKQRRAMELLISQRLKRLHSVQQSHDLSKTNEQNSLDQQQF